MTFFNHIKSNVFVSGCFTCIAHANCFRVVLISATFPAALLLVFE